MYPIFRVRREIRKALRAPRLAPGEVHVARTRCWPTDIDHLWELNNGRSLTLMDMGRMACIRQTRMVEDLARRGARIAIAGSCVQYRRRVKLWEALEIRSKIIGSDARFFYMEQVLLASGAFAHHAVFRVACVGPSGMLPIAEALRDFDHPGWFAPLPAWIAEWSAAEAKRSRPDFAA